MNGILRHRVCSCANLRHLRVVLYCSANPLPHIPPTSTASPQLDPSTPSPSPNPTSDQQSPLPNAALNLPHGLTIRKKPSTIVVYKELQASQLLDVILQRKKAGEPQELLNFIHLIMEYRKVNNTQGIMNAVMLMKEVGVEPNSVIYNMLVTYFGMLKEPSAVKDLIAKMRNRGFDLSDSNYNAPIQAFLTSSNGSFYQDGVDTFHWAANKGVALKTGTYFSLISNAVGQGDDATCQKVLGEMVKHGVEPPDSKDIFDMYISARVLNRNYKGVLEKYAEMRSLGLFPSYPSYTYVFKSASVLRDAVQIHATWKDLRSTMGPPPLKATSISQYNAYIRALALAGDTQGCLEALTQLRADGLTPIARTYLPVLEALVLRQDGAGLQQLISDAEVDGIYFTGFMSAMAKKVTDGDKLDDIRKQGKRPTANAYNVQLANLAKQGEAATLRRTAEEMTHDGIAYDVTTYSTLISFADSKENNDEIRRLYAKMLAEGVRPNATLYNTLAHSFVRMRDAPACAQLVDSMLREGIQLHKQTFQPILSVILENNDMDRCIALLDRVRSAAQDALDVPTYGRIVDLMLSKGDIVGCNSILAEMQAKGVKPSLPIYNSLIGFAAQKGDKNWVSVLMNEISAQGLRADMSTYTRLFEGLAVSGDTEGCDAWVATMRTQGLSPSRAMYHNIISTKAMCGDAEACGRIVREMGIRGMNPEPQAYAVTLHLLVRKGDQSNCRAVYEDMRAKAVVPDRTTYNLVALVSGTDDGLKLLTDMRENAVFPDSETYRALLGSMAWRGDVDGCRRALVEMDRDRVVPDMATYTSLVANLGKHVDARTLCNRLLEGIPPLGFTPFEYNPMHMYGVPNTITSLAPIPSPISNLPPIITPVVQNTPTNINNSRRTSNTNTVPPAPNTRTNNKTSRPNTSAPNAQPTTSTRPNAPNRPTRANTPANPLNTPASRPNATTQPNPTLHNTPTTTVTRPNTSTRRNIPLPPNRAKISGTPIPTPPSTPNGANPLLSPQRSLSPNRPPSTNNNTIIGPNSAQNTHNIPVRSRPPSQVNKSNTRLKNPSNTKHSTNNTTINNTTNTSNPPNTNNVTVNSTNNSDTENKQTLVSTPSTSANRSNTPPEAPLSLSSTIPSSSFHESTPFTTTYIPPSVPSPTLPSSPIPPSQSAQTTLSSQSLQHA